MKQRLRLRPSGKGFRGHDGLVRCIEKDLKDRGYRVILKFVEYDFGEIDLYALKPPNYVLLFEMKSSDRPVSRMKAVSQLKRAERTYFTNSQRVFKFFVYGAEKGVYGVEWVK